MSPSQEHRDLGMDRRIDRRNFLNGVAVGIGGAYAALKGAPAWAAQPEVFAVLGMGALLTAI